MEKRVYFKNLNGLRFIAATAVIFHHVEQYKFWAKLPNVWGNTTIDALGSKAVSFFFVLSGFLITYLLMEERRKTSDISIRDFYVRRVLRIWPVYYLVVGICLFVLPYVFDLSRFGHNLYDNFTLKVILYLLVLPNLVRVFSPSIVGGNQLWSIGVEEQFYLVWPVLVRFFYNNLLRFLVAFIVLKLIITLGLEYASVSLGGPKTLVSILRFWLLLKIEQMAIGAIGAWYLFQQRRRVLDVLYHPITWYVSLACLALILMLPLHHWVFYYLEAFVFLSIIMNLSTNPWIKLSMEHPMMNTLGNISYGIYMYHTLCITVCIYALTHFKLDQTNPLLFNLLLYTGSVVITVAIAFFSYEYFEKFFLSMKEKFMIVKSGKEHATKPTLEKLGQKG